MKTLFLLLIAAASGSFIHAQILEKRTIGDIVETPSGSRAAILVDFNNDTYLDVFISNGTSGGENNLLYLNNGDGTFTSISNDASQDNTPSDGASAADYQNDGWIDLAVVNWYGVNNLLYENSASTSLAMNLVDTSIVSNDFGFSEASSWGDYDNDGYVDLYVTNSAGNDKNALYRNLGNGTFEKQSGISPVEDTYFSRSVNWVDFDNDNDLDLFVSNEGSQNNNLYVNDGLGNFTALSGDTIVSDNFSSFTSSWADVDNDGDLDLFVGNYQAANQLFLNDGNGQFSAGSGPWDGTPNCTFSSSFADYDNDGDKDLFITNGFCASNLTNVLYQNDGGVFTEVMNEPISVDLGSSYGCSWGDINNDGFLELLVANWQNETQVNTLYDNNGNGNNWIKIHLEGAVSNHSAIGARVRVLSTINGVPTWQLHEVTTQSGYCSQNSLVAHFGIGDASTIDSVLVDWPSGISDTLLGASSNQFYALIEGENWGVAETNEMHLDKGKFEVYPNPVTNSELVIRCDNSKQSLIEVQLLALDGKLVQSYREIETFDNNIVLKINRNIENGAFVLKLIYETEAIVVPLILAR